mgnify:CR=1 FL=1
MVNIMGKKPAGPPDKFRGSRGPGRSPRRLAAEAAGMTRHQMHQALALAQIPEDEFDALIESDNPPSLEALARIGRGLDPVRDRDRGPLSALKAAWKNASASERGESLEWIDETD